MEDDGFNLDRLTDKCMSQNSTKKWMKLFKEAGDAQARLVKERNESLKKLKNGQISLDNFDWSEGGSIREDSGKDYKSIELSPEEQEYKQENDEMFGKAKDEDWLGDKPKEPPKRNPNNPYLTKAERIQMNHDESGDEIDATEHDGDIEPNSFEKVEVSFSKEYGLIVKIGNSVGCISQDEIPTLQEFISNGLHGVLEDDEVEDDDEDVELRQADNGAVVPMNKDNDEGDDEDEEDEEGEDDEGEGKPVGFRMIRVSSGPMRDFSSFANELQGMM